MNDDDSLRKHHIQCLTSVLAVRRLETPPLLDACNVITQAACVITLSLG